MKLINILVRELPKRGGWPDDAKYCWQDWDMELRPGSFGFGYYLNELAENNRKSGGKNPVPGDDNCVTCEQYEAALADSKQAWNGDGLPPVGCRVEANYGGEWVEATVAYTDRPEAHGDAVAWKEALVFDCKNTRPFWADEFRPIRSEADKKRDEAVK